MWQETRITDRLNCNLASTSMTEPRQILCQCNAHQCCKERSRDPISGEIVSGFFLYETQYKNHQVNEAIWQQSQREHEVIQAIAAATMGSHVPSDPMAIAIAHTDAIERTGPMEPGMCLPLCLKDSTIV